MQFLSLTPKILVDDAQGLVVEESHLGWISILVAWLLLAGAFLLPAVRDGSVAAILIGLVLSGVVVGIPFLTLLTFSCYRRLEVRHDAELVSVTVYRLRSPRVVRVSWDEIVRVVCERRRTSGYSLDHIRLTLYCKNGPVQYLLGGWYSDDLIAPFGRHLGEKLTISK